MKCPRTAGLGYTNKNSAVARVAPIFSSCKYLEWFRNWGWTLFFCGAGVVYEPQLAKASTPCGVVSTPEKSIFVPRLLGLMGYGWISGTAVEPCPHRVRWNAPRPFAGLACLWPYELHSQSTISQCEQMIVAPSCGAVSTRGRNRLSSPVCQDF